MLAFSDFFLLLPIQEHAASQPPGFLESTSLEDCLLSAFHIPLSLALNFEATGLFISNDCYPKGTNLSLLLVGSTTSLGLPLGQYFYEGIHKSPFCGVGSIHHDS
jgi:hypothetical protein